jgi:endonuclease YncB( thermonuclease family)
MTSRSSRTRRNRRRELLIFAFLVVTLLVAKCLLPEPEPRILSGSARVIDGDSLVVDGVEIRLSGIDGPELAQMCDRGGETWACGREAARQLRFFVRGARISCTGNRFDRYQRLLAVCRQGTREINRWLVEEGWAVSFDDYPVAEREARKDSLGIWSGTFERPSEWRERQGANQ